MHGIKTSGKFGHREDNTLKMNVALLILFLFIALLFIPSCVELKDGEFDAETVREIPLGFVRLPERSDLDNGLRYIPWETQIAFLDSDGNCIYQTEFNNSKFIVKYQDEYYVNEEKLLELINIAGLQYE